MTNLSDSAIELTLIVPAYNEAKIILRTLNELTEYMSSELPGRCYEIIVVDDGSTDGMGEIVAERGKTDDAVLVVTHPTNIGRGRAIRTGFESARGRFMICLDADLSYAPEHISALLDPLADGVADITLASPYHPDGKVSNVPYSRALLSRWGNRVLSAGVFGKFNTLTCIVRGYKRDAMLPIELISDGKDLHLEIIQKATLFGLRIKEVPAHLKWRDKTRGKPKSGGLIKRLPFVSMSSTIASHLVYNYVLRPGSLFVLPVIAMVLVSAIGLLTLLGTWLVKVFWGPGSFGLSKLYTMLRETLLQGNLTLLVIVAGGLTSLIFAAFYFASQQNKKNFEELYILSSRMNSRLKGLEEKINR